MEGLVADFVQFSGAIVRFVIHVGRVGTRLCLFPILRFS